MQEYLTFALYVYVRNAIRREHSQYGVAVDQQEPPTLASVFIRMALCTSCYGARSITKTSARSRCNSLRDVHETWATY
jgi:hypothetical protein